MYVQVHGRHHRAAASYKQITQIEQDCEEQDCRCGIVTVRNIMFGCTIVPLAQPELQMKLAYHIVIRNGLCNLHGCVMHEACEYESCSRNGQMG